MQQEERQDRSLENVIGGPYMFTIKDGTELALDEWTIDAERWAKKKFGSMTNLYNALMNIECEDEDTIAAAIAVAAFKLTEDSRRIVDERRGEKTTEEWLESMVTYKNFADLCRAEYSMIRDSIPIELIDNLKKNPTVMTQQAQKAMHRRKTK